MDTTNTVGPDEAYRRFVENSEIYKPGPVRWVGEKYDTGVVRQSRLESAIESTINIATGFVISWMVWVFIAAPLFGFPFEAGTSLALTSLFTVTSLARSYFWRRFFANDIHRRIHSWLSS